MPKLPVLWIGQLVVLGKIIMQKFKRILRTTALICLMLLASVGIGLTGAAPVYPKDRDALSENKVEQEQEETDEQLFDLNKKF
ncbi:MAG: hypothetical protein KJO64_06210 [Bacteroidia bacterium]|nr:hypothetical protein [Bacteroidia bacterium]NNC84539.1 hypothetical protein [Bacteroidia bacterium]